MKYIHSNLCSFPRNAHCYCVKDRGYQTQSAIPRGTMVEQYDDFSSERWPAGVVGKVEDYTNMGFNGIYAYVIVNGQRITVQAGQLVKADGGASYRDAVRAEHRRLQAAADAAQAKADAWAREHGLLEDAR